jgi:uncharacterized protein YndB with AHSA1/START domain
MTGTDLRYVTYIAAAPEQVWDALMRPERTREFWQHENVSDWKLGSIWEHREPNGGAPFRTGLVIKHDPPNHLLLTWADPRDAANLGAHSRVAIDLEPVEGVTRLTVAHDQLVPSSTMYRDMEETWPRVLSSLKSYLETGRALPISTLPATGAEPAHDRRHDRDERRRDDQDREREARLAEAEKEMARREGRSSPR